MENMLLNNENLIIYYLIDKDVYNKTFKLISHTPNMIEYRLNGELFKIEYLSLISWLKTDNIVIKYDDFEGELCFESSCSKYPDLSEYADSETEAYDLIIDSIVTYHTGFINE